MSAKATTMASQAKSPRHLAAAERFPLAGGTMHPTMPNSAYKVHKLY